MATRSDIRTAARIRADQDNSTFPTDAQYNILIDQACKEVWYELVGAGWPISFSAASATAAASFMPLSSAFSVSDAVAFIRGVYWVNGGQYYELPRVNEGDRAGLMSATGTSTPAYHDVRIDPTSGIGVEILPYVAGATIYVEYVKEHPGLAADGTSWYGPARSDELVVLRAAAKGMRKEGNDQGAMQLDREYMYVLDCVQRMASWANMRHSATIRDAGSQFGPTRLPGDFDIY